KAIEEQKLPSAKNIGVFTTSFDIIEQTALNKIAYLQQDGNTNRWLELHPIYQHLLEHYKAIATVQAYLPPLRFEYDISSLESLVEHSRLACADYWQQRADSLVSAALSGDKQSARKAYAYLQYSLAYAPERIATSLQADSMRDAGIIRWMVEPVQPNSSQEADVLRLLLYDQPVHYDDWIEIHFQPTSARIDFYARVDIWDIYVSTDRYSSSTHCYSKEVQEGTETITKEVCKGDTVVTVTETVPIMITVRGSITEVVQSKEASALFIISVLDPFTDHKLEQIKFTASSDWTNDYEVCEGDRRALPSSCFGMEAMYPSYGSMLAMVVRAGRRILIRKLKQYSKF
ncbi:MAG: hypothetical protein R2795_14825, partial [Saprospiraceae bacterium]